MRPSVHLARLLEGHTTAMVTLVDSEGHLRTRLMTPVPAPFNGHLWFRLGNDAALMDDVSRGVDVSVAYRGEGGPCVTVYGWAIVLHDPASVRALWQSMPPALPPAEPRLQLLCVSARAAEIWDSESKACNRIFAFSGGHPPYCESAAPVREHAAGLRLVGAAVAAGSARSGQRSSASALTGK